MRIVNGYTIRQDELQEDDVMMYVVKAHVQWIDGEGRPRYRIYRCPYDGEVPQGMQMGDPKSLAQQLFPTLANHGEPSY